MDHKLLGEGKRHAPQNYTFATSTQRLAEVVTSDDLYKTAIQLDDRSSWRVIAAGSGAGSWEAVKAVPLVHTHAQTDVTGLVASLAAKADLATGKVPLAQLPDSLVAPTIIMQPATEIVTWASRPLASARTAGALIQISDLNNAIFVNVGQLQWRPLNGLALILSNGSTVQGATGSTTSAALGGATILGGLLQLGSSLRVRGMATMTGVAGTKTLTTSLGGQVLRSTVIPAAYLSQAFEFTVKMNVLGTLLVPGETGAASVSRTLDMTVDQALAFSTVNASAADRIDLQSYSVELVA